MYPTSVPTYSKVIGTSRSTTGSTLTTGAGGGAAARDASPQPAATAAIRPISKPANSEWPSSVMYASRGYSAHSLRAPASVVWLLSRDRPLIVSRPVAEELLRLD